MGLIFSAEGSIDKMLQGVKTQTRRPYKEGDWLDAGRFDGRTSVLRNGRLLWRTGKSYAILPKRGDRAILWAKRRDENGAPAWKRDDGDPARDGVLYHLWQQGRVCLTAIRLEPVAAISDADARAEGYESRDDFLAVWKALYGERALAEQCWALSFHVIDAFPFGIEVFRIE